MKYLGIWTRGWVAGLVLVTAASLVLVACEGLVVGGSEPAVEFVAGPTRVVLADGLIAPETAYVVGAGHTYKVGVDVTMTAAGAEQGAAITEVLVLYADRDAGTEISVPATQVGSSDSYEFDLPGSEYLGLCEPMRYIWGANYDIGGSGGVNFAEWTEVMPTSRYTAANETDRLACAQMMYRDADGSFPIEVVPISVIRGDSCEYRLEFNSAEHPPDFAVHEVGGDPADSDLVHFDSSCASRPNFAGTDIERQTVYFWTMLARRYAIDHIWITPSGWTGDQIHTPDPVGPNVLSDQGGFGTACLLTPGDPDGCFRAFDSDGARFFVAAGKVIPEVILHEYGHYAAGYVFGYMNPTMLGLGGGFDLTSCASRGYQEAIAEIFMALVLHDARYSFFGAGDPIANGVPASSFDLKSSSLAIFDGDCGTSDYVIGTPLVQAFHTALWDGPWSNPREANRALATAFSTALALNKGNYETNILASLVVDSVARDHPDELDAVRGIFMLHGLPHYTGGG
ncbi:MAG: hypothetical protein GY720_03545 [bacterium]|nr:hypothetical protein [bacterium]